jgi:hypothetical protein
MAISEQLVSIQDEEIKKVITDTERVKTTIDKQQPG